MNAVFRAVCRETAGSRHAGAYRTDSERMMAHVLAMAAPDATHIRWKGGEGGARFGHEMALLGVVLTATGRNPDLHRSLTGPLQLGIERNLVADLERAVKRHTLHADRGAAAARSIWLISQPPKMSPAGLVSAGIATVRMAG